MPGTRVVGGLYASIPRIALALGLPLDTDYHDVIDWYIINMKKRLKPVVVDSGPCQKNVITAADIDLLKLPVPLLHPRDGGGESKPAREASVTSPRSASMSVRIPTPIG
jgi:UbiD family decarboxylase